MRGIAFVYKKKHGVGGNRMLLPLNYNPNLYCKLLARRIKIEFEVAGGRTTDLFALGTNCVTIAPQPHARCPGIDPGSWD